MEQIDQESDRLDKERALVPEMKMLKKSNESQSLMWRWKLNLEELKKSHIR